MSDPSRRLERLSINTNQPGRPGQRTHIEGAERTPSKGSDSEMEEVLARGQGASAARPSIPGRSGLIYDLTQLPLLVQKRAASSITTDFSVQTCSTTPNSFIFEVNDPPSPVSLMSSGMTCTCGEYRDDGGKACRHIFWLLDQLYSQTVTPASSPHIPLTPSGPSLEVENLYTFLSTSTLDRLAQRLGWPTKAPAKEQAPASLPARAAQVRDILSTFIHSVLPSDYLVQESANINRPRTAEECNIPLNLEATIFRLAANDLAVYDALNRTQSPAACAEIFYSKIRRLVGETLTILDKYLLHGPSPTTVSGASQSDESYSNPLAITARQLQESVRHVSAGISLRAPHGLRTSFECLLFILNEAVARNRDMYLGVTWERLVPPGEEDWERNLWEWCLRSSAESPETDPGRTSGKQPAELDPADTEEDYFVLDTLLKLPSETLGEKMRQLRTIQERMEAQGVDSAYLAQFHKVYEKAATAEVPQRQTPAHSRAQSRAPTPRNDPAGGIVAGARGVAPSHITPARGRGRGRSGAGDAGSRKAGQKRPASSAGGDAPKRGGGRGARGGKPSK